MTRDTYDITIRRASQLSHKLDLFRTSQNCRRASQITKRSFVQENELRGSDRTLFGSSLDSTSDSVNSSRTNVQTSASCSYTNSRNDITFDDEDDDDDDDDEDDDDGEDEDTAGSKTGEEAEGDKGIWEKNIHYIFLGFGVVFSMRNVIAFPSLVLQHGGGAFLFTYVILTYTVGIPLIYLEVSLGQYARGGVVKAWGIMSLARGICISSLFLSIVNAAFTTTTPSVWALYFVYTSLTGLGSSSINGTTRFANISKSNLSIHNSSIPSLGNNSALQLIASRTDLFYRSSLQVSSSISHFGHIVPHLIIAMFIYWVIVFIYTSLGPRLMGKLSFTFSAIPSVLLFISTIGVCTLAGSVLGIRTFLNPHWEHLNQVKTWLDSLEMVLSGLASGSGVMITLSGYCNFHGNTFRHAIVMSSLSLVMTITCGCLMMATLGVHSKQSGVSISNISQNSDVDFGFVLYPAVSSYLSVSWFWNGIFYTSLVMLGIVRTSVFVHHFHQGFLDLATRENIHIRWNIGILGVLIVLLMCVNMVTLSQNGLYIIRLIHQSISRLATPIICTAQCVTVAWGYGARRFAGRVSEMTGKNKSFLWKWLWRWGCPVVLSISVLLVLMKRDAISYVPTTDNRGWLREIHWVLPLVIIFPGLAVSLASFFKVPGTLKQRLKHVCATPVPWGPGHPEHEPQADLPDYVICNPDPFRPANALAMLTANLYFPNIVNFVNVEKKSPVNGSDMSPGYLSELGTMSSSEDDCSVDVPASKEGFFGRCWATLGCLSHVVGLGNLVRFPYLAYKHGGGSFLLAYVILLLTCGLPLVIIEIAIGQFSSFGPINVWRAVPLFKGLGFSMVVISLVTSVYYGVVTSWAVYYLATALTSVMPWQDCGNAWNTNSCVIITHDIKECPNTTADPFDPPDPSSSIMDSRCDVDTKECDVINLDTPVHTCDYYLNASTIPPNSLSTSVGEYFYKAVLDVSNGLDDPGVVRWQLVLCLLMFWVVVGLYLAKSSKSGGKVTYMIIILPLSLFLILLIRCSALPGGKHGLSYLFTPDFSLLTAGHVWRDAASQVFFSLGIGSGALVTSSTRNKFNSNIFRESILVCIIDTCMSLLISLLMFAVIGAMSHQTGLPLNETVKADPGMPFVLLSHAVLQLPWSLFWAVLVFLSIVLCGLTTCTSGLASAIGAVTEKTKLRKQRLWLTLGMVSGAFISGIFFTFQGGFYMVELFDLHISGLPQLVIGGFTLAAFAWVYGSGRLSSDMSRMIQAPLGWWWRPVWVVISPGFLAACIMMSITSLVAHRDNPDTPMWGTALGIVIWFFIVLPIGGGMVHEICFARSGSFLVRLRRSCRSRKDWGATASRYQSAVEYYPTVHTNLGLDCNSDGLNTITDHVEFTTVGVRVPSLSQTTLLPVSPKAHRTKRPMDMRHKAILNHAYSNPQCNLSSGSLEKMGVKKKKRFSLNTSNESMTNSTLVSKKSKKKGWCNASTQTEKCCFTSKLQRQRSQPFVWVSKPVRMMARSLSWHNMRGGDPAVIDVSDQLNPRDRSTKKIRSQDSLQLEQYKTRIHQHHKERGAKLKTKSKESLCLPKDERTEKLCLPEKRRRLGQSIAPNLGKLLNSFEDGNANKPLLKNNNNNNNNYSKDCKGKVRGTYKLIDSIDAEIGTKKTYDAMGSTSDFKELENVKELEYSDFLEKSRDECRVATFDFSSGIPVSSSSSSSLSLKSDNVFVYNSSSGKSSCVVDGSSQIPTIEISQPRILPDESLEIVSEEKSLGSSSSNYSKQRTPKLSTKHKVIKPMDCDDSNQNQDSLFFKDKQETNLSKMDKDFIDVRGRKMKEMSLASGSVIMEEDEGHNTDDDDDNNDDGSG